MFHLSTIGLVIFFCAAFATITATAQTTSLKDSIAQQEQKLAQARASNDIRTVLTELNVLGSLYRTSGQLQKALDDLPPRCRQIVILRKIDGLPQREVAQSLGVTEEVVESQVAKAMRLLAQSMHSQRVQVVASAKRFFASRRQ